MQSITNEPITYKLPLVDGYTCGGDLVIKNCPNCGRPHWHGNSSYKIGDTTSRVPHCQLSSHWNVPSIVIQIVGEISKTELSRLVSRVKPFTDKAEMKYVDFDFDKIGS